MKPNKQDIINELKDLEANELLKNKFLNEGIPEFYFENLSNEIIGKIQTKPKPSIFRIATVFSIAASVILIFGLFFLSINTQDSTNWQAVNKTELEDYILNNIEDFTEIEIASHSNLEDVSILFSTSIPEEELQNYLLENDTEEDYIN